MRKGREYMPRPYPVTTLAQSASVTEAATLHWKEYVMESTELGALMLSTCVWGTLTYSDESPLSSLGLSAVSSSILMGTAVAVTTYMIIRSPFGRRSGAHMNPSVTLTFLSLGRVHRWDALWYTVAHFVGAFAGVLAARQILGRSLSAPSVQYMVTEPGKHGNGITFAGEFLLSGVLMATILYSSNHRRLARFTPTLVAVLTILFFVLSPSRSGFSVNPARTFSSAVFAGTWEGLWIYFAAPSLGMLLAAAVYIKTVGLNRVYCAKVFHDTRSVCPFRCQFEHVYDDFDHFPRRR
jgi:aquaporin Z